MKLRRLLYSLATIAFLTTFLTACGHDDENSPTIQERIVGTWKITHYWGKDVSSRDITYTFTSDGKMLLSPQSIKFDGWDADIEAVYDVTDISTSRSSEVDNFEGIIVVDYYKKGTKEKIGGYSYDCTIGRKSMMFYLKVGINETPGPFDTRRYIFER